MNNYSEQSATATAQPYKRVRHIDIRNPPVGLPSVNILEAEAVALNGTKVHLNEHGSIDVRIDAAAQAEVFPILNPADDQPLGGTASGAQLMALIYSWARHQQGKRDAAQAGNLGLGAL
jgi:hypothetical protein